MNNAVRLMLVGGLLLGAYATEGAAAPMEDNMVMLPDSVPTPAPAQATAQPQAVENAVSLPPENMVMLPDNATAPTNNESIFVPITGPNYIEAGVNYHNVSNNQGDWFGQFVNAQIQTDPKNRWSTQLQHQKAFKDEGYFVGVGNTHTFDDTWFSGVGVGMGSANTSFLPRFRADADINRRWLEGGNLVTTLGGTFTKATETYTSYGILLGASYYFPSPWIVQGGIRLDLNRPGNVFATSGFAALSYGFQKRYYLSGRVGYGREAYQLLGNGNSITNAFNSRNAGFGWRQWLGEDWGFNLSSEYYANPFYHRTGGIMSVFKEF